jgi:hypothetical protein
MRVYAHLYEGRNGRRPHKAVLRFLGEKDLARQRYDVDLAEAAVTKAVRIFEDTVTLIRTYMIVARSIAAMYVLRIMPSESAFEASRPPGLSHYPTAHHSQRMDFAQIRTKGPSDE